MPIYEYRCENGHTFEAFQAMSEDPLDECEVCDAAASRVLRAPAVHFKGSGFYTTDYARKGKGSKPAPSDGKGEGGKDSKSDSKSASKSSDSGSGSKTGSKSGSGKSD